MDAERPNDRNRLIEFIAATVEAMRDQMVTKGEFRALQAEVSSMRSEMVTRGELRAELGSLRASLKEEMNAGFTAVRGDIERVALQLDQVDRKQSLRTAALESEVSRIRSVVYLVVKDQPDLVRLLGS
jgi:hypothetical protein